MGNGKLKIALNGKILRYILAAKKGDISLKEKKEVIWYNKSKG